MGDAITNNATANSAAVRAKVTPAHASPGDTVTLEVHFQIAPGWHIEPIEHLSYPEPALPVDIDLQLPKNISTMGPWIIPEPQLQFGPSGQTQGYVGNVSFKRRLLIDQHASPGPLELRCSIGYQLCNAKLCTRPTPVELKATVNVEDE